MATQVARQLERLAGRSTLYEIVLEGEGQRYLVAYAPKSMTRCCDVAVKRWQHLERLTGAIKLYRQYRGARELRMGTWIIRFSGRTEREAIQGGELTYVGEA